ncbi:hypothetical protein pb186bvf_004187 [Paramecium bursaria]
MILLLFVLGLIRAATINYSLSNTMIQTTGNILTFNVSTTLPSNGDMMIQLVLPQQITNQSSIVCGITGFTSGACTLLYGVFTITFKSAQPQFQITLMNVNNPMSNYTDPVLINATMIQTQQLLFQQNLSLTYQLIQFNQNLSLPQITYQSNILSISLNNSNNIKVNGSQLILQYEGILGVTTTKALNVGYSKINQTESLLNVYDISMNQSIGWLNISDIMIPYQKQMIFNLSIIQNGGFISFNQFTISPLQVGQINNLSLQQLNSTYGQMNNINLNICNVINGSSVSLNIYSINQSIWNQGCLTIRTNNYFNPNFNQQLLINLTYNGFPSLFGTYDLKYNVYYASLQYDQNQSRISFPALVNANINSNFNISNPKLIISFPYTYSSCMINNQNCTNYVEQSISQFNIAIQLVVSGCPQTLSIQVYDGSNLIIQSNSVQVKQTINILDANYTIDNLKVFQNASNQISIANLTNVDYYTVQTTQNILSCSNCSINGKVLQYQNANTPLTYISTNPNNIQQQFITISGYTQQCLSYQQNFNFTPQPLFVSLAAQSSNLFYNQYSNWSFNLSQIQFNYGYLKSPLIINDSTVGKINSTHIQIQNTNFTIDGFLNIPQGEKWEVSFYQDGLLNAYGSLALQELQYAQLSGFQMGQNLKMANLSNMTLTFNSSIPAQSYQLEFDNLIVNSLILDDNQNDSLIQQGQHQIIVNYNISDNQTSQQNTTLTLNTIDKYNRTLERFIISQKLFSNCSQQNCLICTSQLCQACILNYVSQNGQCQYVQDNQQNNSQETLEINKQESVFKFSPPIISPLIFLIMLFSFIKKLLFKEAEAFIIFYSMSSILEHIIHLFLFIYLFVTNQQLLGFIMVSVITLHIMSQLYIAFIHLFRIDPEYIGVRQKYMITKLWKIIVINDQQNEQIPYLVWSFHLQNCHYIKILEFDEVPDHFLIGSNYYSCSIYTQGSISVLHRNTSIPNHLDLSQSFHPEDYNTNEER